jgi:glycosyltransferase involved in cell wall biosynthesis
VLTKPGDADGLAGALIRVLGDATLRRELQDRALLRVARFDRTAVLDGYLAAYQAAMTWRA